MDEKKGQITIFFIIGLVILIVILFILAVIPSNKHTVKKENKIAIDQYLSSCVDKSFYDIVDDISSIGSDINQPSSQKKFVNITIGGKTKQIMIAIDNNTAISSQINNCQSSGSGSCYEQLSNSGFLTSYFGRLSMFPLCDSNGENRLNNPKNNLLCIGGYNKSSEYSIQKLIEDKLKETVSVCLSNNLRSDVNTKNIDSSEISVKVTFFRGSTKVKVQYGKDSFYEKNYKIPIWSLYFFIREQLKNNLIKPKENKIIANGINNRYYLPGFSLSKKRGTGSDDDYVATYYDGSTGKIHVYALLDTTVTYRGTTPYWIFGVENRPEYAETYGSPPQTITFDPDE